MYFALVDAIRSFLGGGATPSLPTATTVQPEWLVAFTFAATAIASVGILIAAIVKGAALIRRIGHFLDDWNGEEMRPGFEGRPGVLARLAAVEKRTEQLTPNGGLHIADAVVRMEAQLIGREGMPGALDRISERMERIEEHLRLPADIHSN